MAHNLIEAIKSQSIREVEALIALGADVNELVVGHSSLWHGARWGTAKLLRVLLAAPGADPNALCREEVPLDQALCNGDTVAKVRVLLAAGADPNAGRVIFNAGQIWSEEGPQVVDMLVAAGVDVNRPDPITGWTALVHAVCTEEPALVEALVGHGARADLPIVHDENQCGYRRGMTARSIAADTATHYGVRAVAALLRQVEGPIEIEALRAAARAHGSSKQGCMQAARALCDESPAALATLQDPDYVEMIWDEVPNDDREGASKLARIVRALGDAQ